MWNCAVLVAVQTIGIAADFVARRVNSSGEDPKQWGQGALRDQKVVVGPLRGALTGG